MPLTMDQDLDELFGDSAALSIPSAVQSSYGLGQRIDELHACGCTQYVMSLDDARTISFDTFSF